MKIKKYDIYISFRNHGKNREDFSNAMILQRQLENRGYRTFVNYDGLYYGETLTTILEQTPCFLMLLSDNYLRDCRNEKDQVYREIISASRLNKIMICVSFDNTLDYHNVREYLPEEISQIVLIRQVLTIYKDAYLEHIIDSLIRHYIAPHYTPQNNGLSTHGEKRPQNWVERLFALFRKETEDILNTYQPHKVDYDIFISYRRVDGRDHARNVQLALKAAGYKKIFFDYNSIQKGEFTKRIIDAIYSCNDFILVLSPKSMKRCGKNGDPVANEIRAARKYKKNIIPLTIDNKPVRWPRNFPEDLEFIKEIHFHDHKSDSYFEASIEELCTKLKTKLKRGPVKEEGNLNLTEI